MRNPQIARTRCASQPNLSPQQAAPPVLGLSNPARALHSFGQLALTAPAVQRCACSDKQDQDAPAQNVQFKLTVNTPGDVYEQEADATADQVMRMSAPSDSPLVQREAPREDDELQMKALPSASLNLLQRCACEDEAQRQEAGQEIGQGAGGEDLATADVSGVVSSGLASGGRPLDAATRSFMEPRFGHDFSQVRIHDNTAASGSASAVSARAYTVGNNIAFRSGEFAPDSGEGRRLLAHELTHVVQQGASAPLERSVQRAFWVSDLTGPGWQHRDVGVQRDDDDLQAGVSPDPQDGGTTTSDAMVTTSTDSTTTSTDAVAAGGAPPATADAATVSFLGCVNNELASMGVLGEIGILVAIGCGIIGLIGGIGGSLVEPGGGTLTGAGLALAGCLALATGIEVGKIIIALKTCASK